MSLQEVEAKARELELEIQKLTDLSDASQLDSDKIKEELVKARQKMLENAYASGTDVVVLTSHFHPKGEDSIKSFLEKRKKRYIFLVVCLNTKAFVFHSDFVFFVKENSFSTIIQYLFKQAKM